MKAIKELARTSKCVHSNSIEIPHPSEKISILVNALRLVANDQDIKSHDLYIPDNCDHYGFAEGKHNLGTMVQFFADMLEE